MRVGGQFEHSHDDRVKAHEVRFPERGSGLRHGRLQERTQGDRRGHHKHGIWHVVVMAFWPPHARNLNSIEGKAALDPRSARLRDTFVKKRDGSAILTVALICAEKAISK